MRRLALSLSLLIGACSAPRATSVDRSACERQAEGQYRLCTNPQHFPSGEPHELPTSEDLQACERAYHQALGRCSDYETLPLTTTSST